MRRSSGFTLLEVLVALVIVSATGLGLLGAAAAQARAASAAIGKLEATAMAAEIQARLQILPQERLLALDPAEETPIEALSAYRWSVSRSRAAIGEPLELTVTVRSDRSQVILTSLHPSISSDGVRP